MEKDIIIDKKSEKCEIVRVENIGEILKIICEFDSEFKPSLSERLKDLEIYSEKLYENAIFLKAMRNNETIAFAAFYANDKKTGVAYLTQIAVKNKVQKEDVGRDMLKECINYSVANDMRQMKLEVVMSNVGAIEFYKKNGFEFCGEASQYSKYMYKNL